MYYETIQIDFNSDEAIYIQLRNQIILGIATSRMQELREDLQVILAKAVCKNISKEEVHQLVDEIYSNYADE